MDQNQTNDNTYDVKYITGHTIFGNRPGKFIFYGATKVKVELEAHKDQPASVLFDADASTIKIDHELGPRGASQSSQLYYVNGKKYVFLAPDGSGSGNIASINQELSARGADFPQAIKGVKSNKSNKTVAIILGIGVVIVILILVLSVTH